MLKYILKKYWGLGIGDWGLGIGDWGLGPIPNPQSPIPNPQSPIPNILLKLYFFSLKKLKLLLYNKYSIIIISWLKKLDNIYNN